MKDGQLSPMSPPAESSGGEVSPIHHNFFRDTGDTRFVPQVEQRTRLTQSTPFGEERKSQSLREAIERKRGSRARSSGGSSMITAAAAPAPMAKEGELTEWQERLQLFTDSTPVQLVMWLTLGVALFFQDIVALSRPSYDTDDMIAGVLISCFVVFSLEVLLNLLCKPTYLWSFFFWMDLLGTLSILTELSWIAEWLGVDTKQGGTVMRASRTSRVGARAGRLSKFLYFLKVVRVTRLARLAHRPPRASAFRKSHFAADQPAPEHVDNSHFGEKLSESVSKQVAALTLVCILLAPLLTWWHDDSVAATYVELFAHMHGVGAGGYGPIVAGMEEYMRDRYQKPCWLQVAEQQWVFRAVPAYSGDRLQLQLGEVRMMLDIAAQVDESSMYSIALVVFVVAVLLAFSTVLNGTVNKLVVVPLDRIFTCMQQQATALFDHMQVDPGDDEGEVDEMNTIEALVSKMARLVKHVGSGDAHHNEKLRSILADQYVDQNTRHYLMDMNHRLGYYGGPRGASGMMEGDDDEDDYGDDQDIPWKHSEAAAGEQVESSPMPGSAGRDVQMHPLGALSGGGGQLRLTDVAKSPRGAVNEELAHSDLPMSPMAQIKPVRLDPLEHSLSSSGKAGLESGRGLFAEVADPRALERWDFNVLDHTREEMCSCVFHMCSDLGIVHPDKYIPAAALRKLLDLYIENHHDIPYHCFEHVMDVTQTVYAFTKLCMQDCKFSIADRIALMVGALSHDLGHPGQNNMFLINTKHELAVTYNDVSVLENSHVSRLYHLIAEHPEANVFRNLEPRMWREVRSKIVAMILHTDMTKHFEMVSECEVMLEMKGEGGAAGTPLAAAYKDDRQFVLNMIMHASDISNACKPWRQCELWSHRVMEEFFQQGDRERSQGLVVSPMMDRGSTQMAITQCNFIEFVVAPLMANVVRIAPQAADLLANLIANRRRWAEMYSEELAHDAARSAHEKQQEAEKFSKRTQSFNSKHEEVLEEVEEMRRHYGLQAPLQAPRPHTNGLMAKSAHKVMNMLRVKKVFEDVRRSLFQRNSVASADGQGQDEAKVGAQERPSQAVKAPMKVHMLNSAKKVLNLLRAKNYFEKESASAREYTI